ncbi:hypothetical protein SULI_02885 [Saccharolobus solfataricus]|uniref:Uncharacterized protein n=2 Tax=Saccharolobus solfataricus TaxID=2287 RepID=A0A0E3K6S0_SACSO|nr:hypothetical protein [Saccharolobus solfataricus]AKA72962.1 hypothetical protein SULB_0565 [Saccharolobus solfataricus]AKA75661.1 hypothetical protein SULC_0563 [Saccharolobus solfataricus]AKA78354.1 hypothetical protein SULA_0563 [Saccharolobus solfataricus]AZF67473.1 hypothetical protein SULG_02885 [Saccharolobus solfataricus]AZF70093.1 hypothetical protein SULH_02885 [Saccharolobus solfataricus]
METPFYKYALMRNFIREAIEHEPIENFVKEKLASDLEMKSRFCNEDDNTLKQLISEVIEYVTLGKGKGKEDEILNAIISSCH